MTKIAIILGSTRPGRNGKQVADWVFEQAQQRTDAEFELVDLLDYPLPLLDEPLPSAMQQYQQDHTKEWSAKISEFDGYVFVTAEYNHGIPGALKNALDYLHNEWHDKSAAFVGYGGVGAARAIEQLRSVVAELQMASVRQNVNISMMTEFENFTTFKPGPYQAGFLSTLFDQVVAWATALKTLRS